MQKDRNLDSLKKLVQLYVAVLIGGTVLAVVLGIAPFFAYGLHLEDPLLVAGGAFDPKNYPLFDYHTLLGNLTHIFALGALATIPLWTIPLNSMLVFTLLRFGAQVSGKLRVAVVAAIIIGIGLSLVYFTPLFRLVLTWHVD
jgi:hypothetical protein